MFVVQYHVLAISKNCKCEVLQLTGTSKPEYTDKACMTLSLNIYC